MDLFLQAARDCCYTSVYLWTTHEQQTAIALYERYGFRKTEEKESTHFGKWLREERYDLQIN